MGAPFVSNCRTAREMDPAFRDDQYLTDGIDYPASNSVVLQAAGCLCLGECCRCHGELISTSRLRAFSMARRVCEF